MFFIKNVSADEDLRDEPNVEYTVDRSCWTCSSIGAENVIPNYLLNPRWLLSAARAPDTRQKALWDKNHKFRATNEIATRICQAMCEYGMKEFQVGLSALADVESVFKKRCHKTFANPEAEIVDSHAQEDDHEALDHGYSPTIDIRRQGTLKDVQLQTAVFKTSSKTETPILDYLEPPINQELVFSDVEVPPTLKQMDSDEITQDLMDMAAEDLKSVPRYALRGPQRSRGRPTQTQKARKVKNNASLALARDAVTMHQEQLSFVTVQQILSDVTTY
uniref:Uncharacterized protein AlNc14C222G9129 n=1 Tax=Albugo laibachii Nc14 TaxID=890382 RepID=F0WRY6_9STRA|nr:hypothetical protein PITG_23301 [Albugo laibachii Nc14]|eukprot:CCA24103.1 hypothetical protein PITG_23301 [Albugo laibachii Nc14]